MLATGRSQKSSWVDWTFGYVLPTNASEKLDCTLPFLTPLFGCALVDKAPLFGTMRHALFEELIRLRDFSMACAQRACKIIVRKNAESLVAAGLTTREAEVEILKVVPQIQQFVAEFTSFGESHHDKSFTLPNLVPAVGPVEAAVHFMAHDVEAIEEVIVSPELGLKGNIDVVVQAHMINPSSSRSSPASSLTSIELKTGHNQNAQHSHMAQLSLYALMLNALYGGDPSRTSAPSNEGVLLYLNSEALKAVHVAPKMFEMKALIGNRNLVAIETHRSAQPRGVVLVHESEPDSSNATTR
jgi:DNA replication factor Dna2